MKILCGENLINNFSYLIKEYLLWPAFEFDIPIKGLYVNNDKNILEYNVLQFVNINIMEEDEIAKDLGLEIDLISFIKSRLFHKGYIDVADKITTLGKQYIEDLSEKENTEYINIYIDAITGKIIPYIKHIKNYDCFKNVSELSKDEKYYKFKLNQSVGKDSDEECIARILYDKNRKYNYLPKLHLINESIHKMHQNAYIPYFTVQEDMGGNEVYFLVELFMLEGMSGPGDWIVSNGFGKISNFFSNNLEQISQEDQKYITNLRKQLETDYIGKNDIKQNGNNKYNKLIEKIEAFQKKYDTMNTIFNKKERSKDEKKIYKETKNDAIVLITQMLEWTFYYTLHNYKFNVDKIFSEELKNVPKNNESKYIIGNKVYNLLIKLNLKMDYMTKNILKESYNKLKIAYNETPSIFPLFDLIVLALKDEVFFKEFIKDNKSFVVELQDLMVLRNVASHTYNDQDIKNKIDHFYKLFKKVKKVFLNTELKTETNKKSFSEMTDEEISRIDAIKRVEEKLGLLLSNVLDSSLITSFVNIEMFIKEINNEEEIKSNLIILDLYKIYERIFVLMNLSFSDDYKNTNWEQKSQNVGFSLVPKKIKAITKIKKEFFNDALMRKPSSMQAACAAFLALSNDRLLKDIKDFWPTFVEDISLIANLRKHGEAPEEITQEEKLSILSIRENTYNLVKLLTKEEYLINMDK